MLHEMNQPITVQSRFVDRSALGSFLQVDIPLSEAIPLLTQKPRASKLWKPHTEPSQAVVKHMCCERTPSLTFPSKASSANHTLQKQAMQAAGLCQATMQHTMHTDTRSTESSSRPFPVDKLGLPIDKRACMVPVRHERGPGPARATAIASRE